MPESCGTQLLQYDTAVVLILQIIISLVFIAIVEQLLFILLILPETYKRIYLIQLLKASE